MLLDRLVFFLEKVRKIGCTLLYFTFLSGLELHLVFQNWLCWDVRSLAFHWSLWLLRILGVSSRFRFWFRFPLSFRFRLQQLCFWRGFLSFTQRLYRVLIFAEKCLFLIITWRGQPRLRISSTNRRSSRPRIVFTSVFQTCFDISILQLQKFLRMFEFQLCSFNISLELRALLGTACWHFP